MTTQETKTKSRHQPSNASELLIAIRTRHPDETKEQVIGRFADVVLITEPINAAIIREWALLHFNTLTQPARTPTSRKSKEERERERLELTARAMSAIKAIGRSVVLMELVLPHGKKLGDSTGAECAVLSSVIGDWLAKVGAAVNPGEKVRDVLAEDQLRQFYKGGEVS